MNIKTAIVEDDKTAIDRLMKRFQFFDHITITITARSGEEMLKALKDIDDDLRPEIILMDIELPGMSGIDTTAMIKEYHPDIEVIMQTVFEDEQKIFKSIQAGASGYLLKDDEIDDYVDALNELKKGGAPMSGCIARKMLEYVRVSREDEKKSGQEMFELTAREMEILELIVEDLTEHHIADQLYISPHTVRSHIKNIYKKLQVHSRASAVRIALQNNLIN